MFGSGCIASLNKHHCQIRTSGMISSPSFITGVCLTSERSRTVSIDRHRHLGHQPKTKTKGPYQTRTSCDTTLQSMSSHLDSMQGLWIPAWKLVPVLVRHFNNDFPKAVRWPLSQDKQNPIQTSQPSSWSRLESLTKPSSSERKT